MNKKWALMVSEDCGGNYYKKAESDDPQELLAQTKSLNGLRWTIEDANGDFFDISDIHKNIILTIEAMRKAEGK